MRARPSPASERRRGPRAPCRLIVRYQDRQHLRWDMLPLKDLSPGGARFLSEHLFEAGAALKLVFGLPLFVKRVDVPARVVWQKPIYSGRLQMTEYGVAFTSLTPEIRQTFGESVRRTLASLPRPSTFL